MKRDTLWTSTKFYADISMTSGHIDTGSSGECLELQNWEHTSSGALSVSGKLYDDTMSSFGNINRKLTAQSFYKLHCTGKAALPVDNLAFVAFWHKTIVTQAPEIVKYHQKHLSLKLTFSLLKIAFIRRKNAR